MFISREELELRKQEADERVRPIIGEEFIYYHAVGKPNNPALDYGICGSNVVIAGFQYSEDENSPYTVDLAVPTQTEDLFALMVGVQVESAHAQLEGKMQVVFVEYEHRDFIEKAVNAWVKSMTPIKKGNHLSLVVDNVNTVESLLQQPTREPVLSSLSSRDIIDILRQNVGSRWMPKSTLTTYGKQKTPKYLKAADDGDFMRMLLAMENSGLFMRDALRSVECWAVLTMGAYNVIVGLHGEQVFTGAKDGLRAHEWVPRSGVDLDRLLIAVDDL